MSYYQYYQQQPQWGTSGYQVIQPPRPSFQPQPNWGGSQYFQAQAGMGYGDYDEYRDEGFFDNVIRGLKDIFSRGFARPDAELWHRRVYGGQVPIDQIDGPQLGAAAGYEAVRHWQTYRSTYRSPLADDREREKEALAGLAAGEAVKLVSYSQRVRSRHTRREAAEIAAATAERIFAEDFDDPYEMFESRPGLSRRRGSVGRRRSSSFVAQRPIIAASTGGTYVSAQPTGYVSSQSTGAVYGQANQPQYYSQQQAVAQPQYVQAQPQYVSTTGQPVQYVSTGGSYLSGAATGYAQPQYVSTTGQPIQYATTGGVQYAQPGVQYATTGGYGTPQYVSSPGVQYATTGQQQYMTVPQGYTRARALSTGAPTYVYR